MTPSQYLRDEAARRLTAEVKAERQSRPLPCAWCANPSVIAKLSAPQCDEHLALNRLYSKQIYEAATVEELKRVMEEVEAKGRRIAERRAA